MSYFTNDSPYKSNMETLVVDDNNLPAEKIGFWEQNYWQQRATFATDTPESKGYYIERALEERHSALMDITKGEPGKALKQFGWEKPFLSGGYGDEYKPWLGGGKTDERYEAAIEAYRNTLTPEQKKRLFVRDEINARGKQMSLEIRKEAMKKLEGAQYGWWGGILGDMVAYARDPKFILTQMILPEAVFAKLAAKGVKLSQKARVGLRAGVDMGATVPYEIATQKLQVQPYKQELGLPHTNSDVRNAVFSATIFAGIFGATFEGAAGAYRKVMTGEWNPKQAKSYLAENYDNLTPEQKEMVDMSLQAFDHEQLNPYGPEGRDDFLKESFEAMQRAHSIGRKVSDVEAKEAEANLKPADEDKEFEELRADFEQQVARENGPIAEIDTEISRLEAELEQLKANEPIDPEQAAKDGINDLLRAFGSSMELGDNFNSGFLRQMGLNREQIDDFTDYLMENGYLRDKGVHMQVKKLPGDEKPALKSPDDPRIMYSLKENPQPRGMLEDRSPAPDSTHRKGVNLNDTQSSEIVKAYNDYHKKRIDWNDVTRAQTIFDDYEALEELGLMYEESGDWFNVSFVDNEINLRADQLTRAASKNQHYVNLTDLNQAQLEYVMKGYDSNPVSAKPEDLRLVIDYFDGDLDSSVITLEPKDYKKFIENIRGQEFQTTKVKSVSDLDNVNDHLALAKAFQKYLDIVGVEYKKIEGLSQYFEIKKDSDEFVKIRFADHHNQSWRHENADVNVYTDFDDSDKFSDAVRKVDDFLYDRGTFDPDDPRILKALKSPDDPAADALDIKLYYQLIADAERLLPKGIRFETPKTLGEAAGSYSHELGLVRVALDVPEIGKTLRHEALHAVRDRFKPEEWATLEEAAAKIDFPKEGIYKAKGIEGEDLAEERVANLIEYAYKGGDISSLEPKPRGMIEKIVAWIKALATTLKKPEYNQLKTILDDFESGAIAGRDGDAVGSGSFNDLKDTPESFQARIDELKARRDEMAGNPLSQFEIEIDGKIYTPRELLEAANDDMAMAENVKMCAMLGA